MAPLFTILAGVVPGLIENWQKRKAAALDNEIKVSQSVADAKIKLASEGKANDFAWEITSLNNSGWKDEWFTLILSIPLIMCFVPGWEVYVTKGFAALDRTPDWYQWVLMIAIGSAYGVRKLVDFMKVKKGV